MSGKLEFGERLVRVFETPVTKEQAIQGLVTLLEEGGYVKETFGEAVLEREKVFPTGLPTRPIGIAIPHTDTEHVKRGAIAVGVLPSPVLFEEMGSPGSYVEVRAVSILAIPDPKAVMTVLRQLAGAFQNQPFLTGLQAARTGPEVVALFSQTIPEVVELV